MIDERTTHLNLPLPHAENLLEDDVQRIRQALTGLDAAVAQQQAQMAASATVLDAQNNRLDASERRLRRLWLERTLDLRLF